jgi:hypothetical protein
VIVSPTRDLADVLHSGDEVPHLADAEPARRPGFRRDDAELEQFVRGPRRHHLDALARADVTVHHPDVCDHAAVDVIDRVEDHRPGRRCGVTDRRRYLGAHEVEQLGHTLPGLRAHPQHIVGRAADDVGQFCGVCVGLRGR